MPWKKKGDIDDTNHLRGSLTKGVEKYTLKEKGYYAELEIIKLHNHLDSGIGFRVWNIKIFEKFQTTFQRFKPETELFNFPKIIKESYQCHLYLEFKNLKDLNKFLSAINYIFPLDREIYNRICRILGVKACLRMSAEELQLLVQDKGLKTALKAPLDIKDDQAIVELAQYFEKQAKWDEAIQCYEAIITQSSSDIHNQACDAIFDICTKILNASDNRSLKLSIEEYRDYLQLQFWAILNKKNRSLEDNIWANIIIAQLAGESFGSSFKPKTVMKLADKIYVIKQTNEDLKQTNDELKRQNENLKRQNEELLAKLAATEKAYANNKSKVEVVAAKECLQFSPDNTPPNTPPSTKLAI